MKFADRLWPRNSTAKATPEQMGHYRRLGQEARRKPNLGLATTRELLDEIRARIEVDGANGGGGLDYRTVGDADTARDS